MLAHMGLPLVGKATPMSDPSSPLVFLLVWVGIWVGPPLGYVLVWAFARWIEKVMR